MNVGIGAPWRAMISTRRLPHSCDLLPRLARHAASSTYVERSRISKLERRRLSIACEDDAELVNRFLLTCKQSLGKAALHHELYEPLSSIFDLCARGDLSTTALSHHIAHLPQAAVDAASSSSSHTRDWSTLRKLLRARVPSSAFEMRLQKELGKLPEPNDRAATNAALSILMHGAVRAGSATMQRELMERFRSLVPTAKGGRALCTGVDQESSSSSSSSGDRRGSQVGATSPSLLSILQLPLLFSLEAPEAEGLPEVLTNILPHLTSDLTSALGTQPHRLKEDLECLLAAAELARQGDQPGPKHGCLILDRDGHLLGAGYNHYIEGERDAGAQEGEREEDAHENERRRRRPRGLPILFRNVVSQSAVTKRGLPNRQQRVVHAEVHAVADAIRRHGEETAFAAFPHATAWVAELIESVGYDDAHPCPKCSALLRAVGLRAVRHTTGDGTGSIAAADLGSPTPHLLRERRVTAPLALLLRETFGGVPCSRLGEEFMRSCSLGDLRTSTPQ